MGIIPNDLKPQEYITQLDAYMDSWKVLAKALPLASDLRNAIQNHSILKVSIPLNSEAGVALPLRLIANLSFRLPRPEMNCSLLCLIHDIPKIGNRVFGLDVVDHIEMHPIPECFKAMGFPDLQGPHKHLVGHWNGKFRKIRFGEREDITLLQNMSILTMRGVNVILSEFLKEIRVRIPGTPIPDPSLDKFFASKTKQER